VQRLDVFGGHGVTGIEHRYAEAEEQPHLKRATSYHVVSSKSDSLSSDPDHSGLLRLESAL